METTTDKKPRKLYGLYAITPCSSIQPLSISELNHKVERAIAGGANIVQYREKRHSAATRRDQAASLRDICRRHRVLFIVNDDVALAAEVGADGVHLGCDDVPLQRARNTLGPDTVIGVSCYNRLDLAHAAQEQGVDYVAFGRFFTSQSKPGAIHADIELLKRAKAELSVPVACIGGITAENAKLLTSAGADMIAVIHGIFGAPDIERAAQDLTANFE